MKFILGMKMKCNKGITIGILAGFLLLFFIVKYNIDNRNETERRLELQARSTIEYCFLESSLSLDICVEIVKIFQKDGIFPTETKFKSMVKEKSTSEFFLLTNKNATEFIVFGKVQSVFDFANLISNSLKNGDNIYVVVFVNISSLKKFANRSAEKEFFEKKLNPEFKKMVKFLNDEELKNCIASFNQNSEQFQNIWDKYKSVIELGSKKLFSEEKIKGLYIGCNNSFDNLINAKH